MIPYKNVLNLRCSLLCCQNSPDPLRDGLLHDARWGFQTGLYRTSHSCSITLTSGKFESQVNTSPLCPVTQKIPERCVEESHDSSLLSQLNIVLNKGYQIFEFCILSDSTHQILLASPFLTEFNWYVKWLTMLSMLM